MKKPLIFAIRGAAGFGLATLLVFTAFWVIKYGEDRGTLVYRLSHWGTPSFAGLWYSQKNWYTIISAWFGDDGSFVISYDDVTKPQEGSADYSRWCGDREKHKKIVTGTYSMTDTSTVLLNPAAPWVFAKVVTNPKLSALVELHVVHENGTMEVLVWADHQKTATRNPPLLIIVILIGYLFMAGTLGATLLYYGTAHWVKAALGFGVSFILLIGTFFTSSFLFWAWSESHQGGGSLGFSVMVWASGYAVFGGIGGCCKCRSLVMPGVFAFGLPPLLLGILAWMTSNTALLLITPIACLSIGGALFGYFVGRSEERACITPQPQD